MILQTKIAISVFFLSLFRVILFIIKGLLPMAFFIHCMSSGVRPKHANYKPNGSYNVIYLLWSGAEKNSTKEEVYKEITLHCSLLSTLLSLESERSLLFHTMHWYCNTLFLVFWSFFFPNIIIYFTVSSCLPKQICRQLLELLYIVRSGVT